MVRAEQHGVEAPPEFYCPITGEVMDDPVVLQTGRTYDRKSIQDWFKGHSTCPETGAELTSIQLTPNSALKAMIQSWKDRHPGGSPSPGSPSAGSASSTQNGSYPTLQGSMYPNLAVDGRPQDKLAQVQAAVAKLKSPSMDMPSYRQQRIYELWTLGELMQDPICCHELLSQQGLAPVMRCLHSDNTAECQAASSRIVQRLAKCREGSKVFDTVHKSGGLERLTLLLSVTDPAKGDKVSCREAAAAALRDLAATSAPAQQEVFFQFCARAKQLDETHRQKLSIILPLRLLWQMASPSESAAAASLIVQLTTGMPFAQYRDYYSCEGTAAIPALVGLLNTGDSQIAAAAIKAVLNSPANRGAMVSHLVDGLAMPPKGREAAGQLLWSLAAGNPSLVAAYSGVPQMPAVLEVALRGRSFSAAGLTQMLTHDHPKIINSVFAPPNTDAVRTQLVSHQQVVPSLVSMLYSDDQQTAQAAVYALANLTAYRSGASSDSGRFGLRRTSSNMTHPAVLVLEAMESKAMPRLMALLDCSVPGIVAPAVALLNNLCADNDTRDKVREASKDWGWERFQQRLHQIMAWNMLPEQCRAAARVAKQRLTCGKLHRAPETFQYITLLLQPPFAA